MSAKLEKKRFIHDEVSEWIWVNFIDPANAIGVWRMNAQGETVQMTQQASAQKTMIMSNRLKMIFGNIADYSAGPTTNFPSVTVTFETMNVVGVDNVPAIDGNFNLRTLVENLKNFISTNQDQRISGSTLREVCRSFANYALEYYMDDQERQSNLADKMPQLALMAREVMFDFSDGISPGHLRAFPNRTKVIQELNSRLLQASGTKAVFEAKGTIESSVNLIV